MRWSFYKEKENGTTLKCNVVYPYLGSGRSTTLCETTALGNDRNGAYRGMQDRDWTERGGSQAFSTSRTHPGWGEIGLHIYIPLPLILNILVYLYLIWLLQLSVWLLLKNHLLVFISYLIAFEVNIYFPSQRYRYIHATLWGYISSLFTLPLQNWTLLCASTTLSKYHQLLVNKHCK